MQLNIFTHKPYCNLFIAVFNAVEHFVPVGQIGFARVYAKLAANNIGKVIFFKHNRRFIKHGNSHIFNNAIGLYIAEKGNFLEYIIFKRLVAAQHYNIRVNAHALQFLNRVLGRLGFMLIRPAQERH